MMLQVKLACYACLRAETKEQKRLEQSMHDLNTIIWSQVHVEICVGVIVSSVH